MTHRILYMIIPGLLALLQACRGDIDPKGTIDAPAPIMPDYAGVTVPANIAPLDFSISDPGDCAWGAVVQCGNSRMSIHADSDGNIVFPISRWRTLLSDNPGDSLVVTVCRDNGDGWQAYRPFAMYISPDTIDNTLVYRLIQPLYGTWRYMGIYQRDLTGYDETPIYENAAHHGNCVNCHSFCARNPGSMQIHLRGDGGGTYVLDDGHATRLDTKTDSTISNFTYPYWHPGGRYIAYSVNNIFQIFHTSDPNRVEVIDDASDIVVYDTQTNTAHSSPLIRRADRMETFPAFSADGRRLYFCSAVPPSQLPEQYRETRYSLCSIDFDPATGRFGHRVDTIFSATDSTGSMSCPRPSPDGRWLVATHADYGQFLIWHKEADLWMCDLADGTWRPMTAANSADVESYHSWSGNSRWLVFSSRRDNGLYTRPYIVHVDADGKVARPFVLPQKYPAKYYTEQMNSFNIPELVSGPVRVGTTDVIEWIDTPTNKVSWK